MSGVRLFSSVLSLFKGSRVFSPVCFFAPVFSKSFLFRISHFVRIPFFAPRTSSGVKDRGKNGKLLKSILPEKGQHAGIGKANTLEVWGRCSPVKSGSPDRIIRDMRNEKMVVSVEEDSIRVSRILANLVERKTLQRKVIYSFGSDIWWRRSNTTTSIYI